MHGEGNGNLLQCSCLENPRDGGAYWAAVYGVAQSRTRLKRLSSSSLFPSFVIDVHKNFWFSYPSCSIFCLFCFVFNEGIQGDLKNTTAIFPEFFSLNPLHDANQWNQTDNGKPPFMIFSKSRRFWDVIVINLKLILVSLRVAVCPAKKHLPASLAARDDHVIQFWPIRYKHKTAVGLWRKLTKSQVNSTGQPTPFALSLLFTCQKLRWAAKSWAAKYLCKVVKMKLTVNDWLIYCDSLSKRLNRRKCWLPKCSIFLPGTVPGKSQMD